MPRIRTTFGQHRAFGHRLHLGWVEKGRGKDTTRGIPVWSLGGVALGSSKTSSRGDGPPQGLSDFSTMALSRS